MFLTGCCCQLRPTYLYGHMSEYAASCMLTTAKGSKCDTRSASAPEAESDVHSQRSASGCRRTPNCLYWTILDLEGTRLKETSGRVWRFANRTFWNIRCLASFAVRRWTHKIVRSLGGGLHELAPQICMIFKLHETKTVRRTTLF
jgi:hypothetical protein